MFDRIYIEITNICNLKCSFCPGTRREKTFMSAEHFREILNKIKGHTDYVYLHVMGEPLLHPELDLILKSVGEFGLKACITTNGTLLSMASKVLIKNKDSIHRISVSLHAPEGNDLNLSLDGYLEKVFDFADEFSLLDKNVIFRLWNLDTEDVKGKNAKNSYILDKLRSRYPNEWSKRYSGYRIAYRTFLEYDGIFTWPIDSDAEPTDSGRCLALSRQIAILADGTVVPCCLDSEGQMALGNIFVSELDDILSSPISAGMLTGFMRGKMVHSVCKKCTYARRFKV